MNGLVRSKHCPRGNPEQQRISNLAGRAGDSYFDGVIHNEWGWGDSKTRTGHVCETVLSKYHHRF
jgi:hypothetical protein